MSAALSSAGGVVGDQWLEFFSYDAFPNDILAVKGRKRTSRRGQNLKTTDNTISNGSKIAVANGQCALIVEQGRILDLCDRAGEYVFTLGGESSVFSGGTKNSALASAWERFKFGGQPGRDTRVYYINTKEITDNKFGTANPVPFRVVDRNIGLDVDIAIRFFGQYSYRISNPILFFMSIAGNFPDIYHRSELDSQLKAELMSAIQPALAKLSAWGIRYSELPGCTEQLTEALNELLAPKWQEKRGIALDSFAITSVTAAPEDEKLIKDLQRAAVLRDPAMAHAVTAEMMAKAQAGALQTAASNQSGSINGLVGLSLAQQVIGGMTLPLPYGQTPISQPIPVHR